MKVLLIALLAAISYAQTANGTVTRISEVEFVWQAPAQISSKSTNISFSPIKLRNDPDLDTASDILNNLAAMGSAAEKAGDITKDILPFLDALSEFAPELAIFGSILSLVSIFSGPQVSPEMQMLKHISSQIQSLQDDVNAWFKALSTEIHRESCFERYSAFEQTITAATEALMEYRDNPNDYNRRKLIELCDGAKCDMSTITLLNGLNGNGGEMGCDLMDVFYKGDPANNVWAGGFVKFPKQMAYMAHLITLGINAQGAYYALTSGDKNGYKDVSSEFQATYQSMIQRMKDYFSKSSREFVTNFEAAVQSLWKRSSPSPCLITNGLMSDYGSRYWISSVYFGTSKGYCWSTMQGYQTTSSAHSKEMIAFAIPKSTKGCWGSKPCSSKGSISNFDFEGMHAVALSNSNSTRAVDFSLEDMLNATFSSSKSTQATNLGKNKCEDLRNKNKDNFPHFVASWAGWGSGWHFCRPSNLDTSYYCQKTDSKHGDWLDWCWF